MSPSKDTTYHHKIEDQLPQSTNVSHYKLMKAYVGVSKNSLDIADLDLDLIQTVTSFGSFIKYVVKSDEKEGSAVGEATNSALSTLSLTLTLETYTVMNLSNSCTIQQSTTPYVFTVGSLNHIKTIKITPSVCHAKTSLPLAKRSEL